MRRPPSWKVQKIKEEYEEIIRNLLMNAERILYCKDSSEYKKHTARRTIKYLGKYREKVFKDLY